MLQSVHILKTDNPRGCLGLDALGTKPANDGAECKRTAQAYSSRGHLGGCRATSPEKTAIGRLVALVMPSHFFDFMKRL